MRTGELIWRRALRALSADEVGSLLAWRAAKPKQRAPLGEPTPRHLNHEDQDDGGFVAIVFVG